MWTTYLNISSLLLLVQCDSSGKNSWLPLSAVKFLIFYAFVKCNARFHCMSLMILSCLYQLVHRRPYAVRKSHADMFTHRKTKCTRWMNLMSTSPGLVCVTPALLNRSSRQTNRWTRELTLKPALTTVHTQQIHAHKHTMRQDGSWLDSYVLPAENAILKSPIYVMFLKTLFALRKTPLWDLLRWSFPVDTSWMKVCCKVI